MLIRTYEIRMAMNEVILDDSLFNIFSDPKPIYFRSIESIKEISRNRIAGHTGTIDVQIRLGKISL